MVDKAYVTIEKEKANGLPVSNVVHVEGATETSVWRESERARRVRARSRTAEWDSCDSCDSADECSSSEPLGHVSAFFRLRVEDFRPRLRHVMWYLRLPICTFAHLHIYPRSTHTLLSYMYNILLIPIFRLQTQKRLAYLRRRARG